MAQIVTITNPLTGQPTQVDQLEHTAQQIDDAIARAIPGGAIDMTLQNNDPKKWGLGIVLANTPGTVITDFDNILPTGFYYVQSGSLNRPIHGAVYAVVINRSYDDVTVFAESPDGVIARRKYKESWGVWEYLNPPMMSNTNTEYRTTERYLGKPVYTKAIYFGPLANGTLATPHGIEDIDAVIYCGGTLDYQGRSMPYWSSTEDYAICKANRTDITTIVMGNGWTTQNYTAIIKYTKTTDQ